MGTMRWWLAPLVLAAGPLLAATAGDLLPVTFKEAPQHAPVTLTRDGAGVASIAVMNPRPSRRLTAAINELQACIKETTGATLPITRGRLDGPAIVIGDCAEAEAAGLVGKAMPIEGFAIKTAPERVYIVGRDETLDGKAASEGTAWGVYEFLERFVGVRWYWPTDRGGRSLLPRATLAVSPVWLEDAPVFPMRVIWPDVQFPNNGSGQQLGGLHAALRANNAWPVTLQVHTPYWDKVPEFVKERPEVFQMRSDGTRNTAMLCYGNPRTLETYLEEIARVYDRGQPVNFSRMGIHGNAITVSPGDMDVACFCPDCRKRWDDAAGGWGTASRVMADFVLRLARAVQARWPDKTIIFLPYMNYTLAPDGYTFPGNVEVQICGMPGLAMYKEPAVYAAEQANIDKWMRISGRKVQNWHYPCWPEDRINAPYQYPHVAQQFYRDNREKTVGTFLNGVTDHWPRQHVTLYAWLKLLWNPDFDVDAAIDEYCRRMYGPAAKTMRELVRIQMDGWEQSRWPGGKMSPKAVYELSFPGPVVARMTALLAQARAEAADLPEVLARIDYYGIPFPDFVKEYETVIEGKGVRLLTAKKVAENPRVDGKLDDPAWGQAEGVTLVKFERNQESEATFPTTVKAVWTLEGVTFGFHLREPAPATLARDINARDDSMAWWNDNVEFFLDVTGEKLGKYYQFIINANAAVYDADTGDAAWNCEGIVARAHVGEDEWSLEVYFPYAAFPDTRRPGTGVEWYGQFTRHRVNDSRTNPGSRREYQRLNAKFGGPSKNMADFAPIKFIE